MSQIIWLALELFDLPFACGRPGSGGGSNLLSFVSGAFAVGGGPISCIFDIGAFGITVTGPGFAVFDTMFSANFGVFSYGVPIGGGFSLALAFGIVPFSGVVISFSLVSKTGDGALLVLDSVDSVSIGCVGGAFFDGGACMFLTSI